MVRQRGLVDLMMDSVWSCQPTQDFSALLLSTELCLVDIGVVRDLSCLEATLLPAWCALRTRPGREVCRLRRWSVLQLQLPHTKTSDRVSFDTRPLENLCMWESPARFNSSKKQNTAENYKSYIATLCNFVSELEGLKEAAASPCRQTRSTTVDLVYNWVSASKFRCWHDLTQDGCVFQVLVRWRKRFGITETWVVMGPWRSCSAQAPFLAKASFSCETEAAGWCWAWLKATGWRTTE